MYSVGVDLGSSYCKCVVINDGEIKTKVINAIKGDPQSISKKIIKDILSSLKIKEKEIKFVTTGRNRKKFPFKNEERTEVLCIAKGSYDLIPSIRTMVDMGALTNKAIKINDNGKVMEYVINDKCASGSGMFLELVAKALEMNISELGERATAAKNPLTITSQCSIFGESEVIYLVNEGKDELDIAAGVCNSIGGQVYSLLKRVRMEEDVALVGGVANNSQIRRNVEQRLEIPIKTFSINPSYVAAYGAALYATDLPK